MKTCRVLATVFLAAVIYVCFAPSARADDWNRRTLVTVNEPVEIPGVVLLPGTYVFKLAALDPDRNMVQIFDRSGKRLYATIAAVSDYRLEIPKKTIITVVRRAKDAPEAIATWFYPANDDGEEFVYPSVRSAAGLSTTRPGSETTQRGIKAKRR